MQLFAAIVCQLVFLVMQVYAAPFKTASDNYWALSINVMLVFALLSCLLVEVDELVSTTEATLSDAMRHRFNISTGAAAALLFFSTLFALAASLPILLRTLNERHQYPLLQYHRRRPPQKTLGVTPKTSLG